MTHNASVLEPGQPIAGSSYATPPKLPQGVARHSTNSTPHSIKGSASQAPTLTNATFVPSSRVALLLNNYYRVQNIQNLYGNELSERSTSATFKNFLFFLLAQVLHDNERSQLMAKLSMLTDIAFKICNAKPRTGSSECYPIGTSSDGVGVGSTTNVNKAKVLNRLQSCLLD
jgi:hypothetical protein